jgi:hypothetical protein
MSTLRKALLVLALIAPLGVAACLDSNHVTAPADPQAAIAQDTTQAPPPSTTSDPTCLCGIGMQGSGGRIECTCQ